MRIARTWESEVADCTTTLQGARSKPLSQNKKELHTTNMEFIPGIQDWFNIQSSINVIHHFNSLRKENHIITPMMKKKHLTKSKSSEIQAHSKVEVEENFLNLIKNIYEKPNVKLYLGKQRTRYKICC